MSYPKTGAIKDGADMAELVAKDASWAPKGMLPPLTTKLEEISEENQNELQGLFTSKETEGRRHRLVRDVEGKKKLQCMRCRMMSLYDKVPCVCNGPKRVKGNRERHRWRDNFVGGHHLSRIC